MRRRFALLAAALMPIATIASADTAVLEALRADDARLAAIAWRLTTTNAALCDRLQPATGAVIQTLGQFPPAGRADARATFGFERPVAIEAVVAGSAADRAGVRPNDSLAAIAGQPVDAPPPATGANADARDAVLARIAALPPAQPMRWTLVRDGSTREVTLHPVPACRSDFEVLPGPKLTAAADGRLVQIGSRFFERYDDAQIAVVVAHELAHDILHHRERLDAAGVSRGLLAEVGRNGRLFRTTEDQADRLGAILLRNAGYDPQSAVRWWREHGGDVDGGLFRSRTHPSSAARAKSVEAEIARIPAHAPMPYVPPLIAESAQPLD